MMSVHSNTPRSLTSEIGSGWGWVFAYGLILIVIGVLAFANPIATGVATGILFAAMLLIYGVVSIVSGFSALRPRHRWLDILLGVLAVLAGLVVMFAPLSGAASLVWAFGFWLTFAGVLELIGAFQSAFDKGWRLFLGALDLVLGLILLFASPQTSLLYLASIIGISFLFRGAFLLLLALSMRRMGHARG